MGDATLSDRAMFGSRRWAAETLGVSVDTFDRKRDDLYASGFPRPDPLLGSYLKADVLAWVDGRSCATVPASKQGEEPRYDQL